MKTYWFFAVALTTGTIFFLPLWLVNNPPFGYTAVGVGIMCLLIASDLSKMIKERRKEGHWNRHPFSYGLMAVWVLAATGIFPFDLGFFLTWGACFLGLLGVLSEYRRWKFVTQASSPQEVSVDT